VNTIIILSKSFLIFNSHLIKTIYNAEKLCPCRPTFVPDCFLWLYGYKLRGRIQTLLKMTLGLGVDVCVKFQKDWSGCLDFYGTFKNPTRYRVILIVKIEIKIGLVIL